MLSYFNIIGDVVNLFKDNYTNSTVHKKLKINLEVQDAEGNKIFVTLWECFAKQILEYVSTNLEKTSLVIILQFGRLNYYMGMPYVNNTYRYSKLFINENTDDIVTLKRKLSTSLLAKSGGQSSLSHHTISSSIVYSLENEFLSRNNFYQISAIHVSIILRALKATNDEQSEVVQKEEIEVFWCSNPKPECQNNVVHSSCTCSRVGWCSHTYIRNSEYHYNKIGRKVSRGTDKKLEYPAELTDLIDKKIAFEQVVSKLTTNTQIISQLEIIRKNLTTEHLDLLYFVQLTLCSKHEVENETYNDTLTDPPSQETVNLKDDTSETGDNSTPLSNKINNNHLNTPGPKLNTNTLNPVVNELKRKFVDVYDADAPESESATKSYVKSNSGSNSGVSIKLLIPKIEK
ncbi:hypothetical protein LXL04_031444 [Taraxacum kok-saghyz]